MLPIPINKATILAVAWLASIAGTAYLVWDYTTAKAAEDRLEAVHRAIAQQAALDAETDELEQAAAERQRAKEASYRRRIREVEDYAKHKPDRVECLDVDGVRLYNRLRAGVEDAGYGSVRP